MYKMYLDDIREPKTKGWVVVRDYGTAIEVVKSYGMPQYISFDHDLGDSDEKTGYDFAKWLVDFDQDHDIMGKGFKFNVHSANPVGEKNITALLDNYMKYKHGE